MEHFEVVGTLAGWNDHFKLMHLTSALKGAAKSFFPFLSADTEEQLSRDGGCAEEKIYSGVIDCGADQIFPLTSTGAEGECRQFRSRAEEAPHEGVCGCYLCEHGSRESGSDSPYQPVCIRPTTRAAGEDRGGRGSMDELILKGRFEEAKTKEFAAVRTSVPFPRRPSAPHGYSVTTSTPSLTRNSWKAKPTYQRRKGAGRIQRGVAGVEAVEAESVSTVDIWRVPAPTTSRHEGIKKLMDDGL